MSQTRTRPLIRALLIDVSGNLHIENNPTPNAVDAFRRLRASCIPFRLCSNTSKESTQSIISRLNKLGFSIVHPQDSDKASTLGSRDSDCSHGAQRHNRQEVWTSIGAVARYIQNQGFKRPYLLLSPSAREEVTRNVLPCPNKSNYDSVIVGLAPELFDYPHLNSAFRILKGETTRSEDQDNVWAAEYDTVTKLPPRLIATHKAKYIQTENPYGLSLGPGPFVSALEMAAGVEAHVIGKPTRLFFETVVSDLYASGELEHTEERGRIAVIGDDVEADLGDGAIQMGLWRILVRTGKYRNGDENRPGITPPDEIFDSFAAFIDSVLSTQALTKL